MGVDKSMTAAVLDVPGAPFRVMSVARPVPQSGQVLVRIEASGVNPLDIKIHAGEAPTCAPPVTGDLRLGLGRRRRGVSATASPNFAWAMRSTA